MSKPPCRDDGRGRDLSFHTLPPGSRMLGLRPISKIYAACAARAHLPTVRGTLLSKADCIKRDCVDIIHYPAEKGNGVFVLEFTHFGKLLRLGRHLRDIEEKKPPLSGRF